MTQILAQNFFETVTTETIPASGDFNVELAQSPTGTKGFIVFDFANASTREEVYYYNRVGNRIYVKAEGRTTPFAHGIGATAKINNTAGFTNYLSNLATAFGYVEKTGGLTVSVWGGQVRYNETVSTVADKTLTLSAGVTSWVYFDYATLDFLATTTEAIAIANGIIIAEVITSGSSVSTITYETPRLQFSRGIDGVTIQYDSDGKMVATGIAGGTVQSIVAGTNIAVDDTDPANPIVSVVDLDLTNILTEVPAGTIDGVNDAFTISTEPVANGLSLYLNGILQTEGTDYTISATNITMINIPVVSDIFIARIITSVTGMAGSVLWGNISGTLADQTDLQSALDAKAGGSGTADGTNTGDETTATIKSKLGITTLSGSNTGDQASIVGITGTKAEFDTAVTDGDIVFEGDSVTGLNMNTDKLLGRSTAGSGAVEEITLGTGLSFTGTTLNASTATAKAFSITKSGSQSIPQNITTRVTWDVETFDTDGFHTGSSGNVVLTAGYWAINTVVELDTIGTGTTDLSLSINGGSNTIYGSGFNAMGSYTGAPTTKLLGYGILYVATTSTIGVDISKTFGGTANATNTSRFSGILISPA